tara:strand:- start:197 stop:697 length:501 start_codon:yes stop_codon:yes gene_type:complete
MKPFHHVGKVGMRTKKEIQSWRQQLKDAGINASYAHLKKVFEVDAEAEVYVNDIYTVTKSDAAQAHMIHAGEDTGWPAMWYLSIKRNDKEVIWDWRELQEIKNLICGEDNEGMQLFPAESRLVDTANQFHLFVIKQPGLFIPVGFPVREVTDASVANTKQRTFASK